jgi:hypothetical protein
MSRLTGKEVYSLMEAYQQVYAPKELTEEQVWEEVEYWVNSLLEEGYDLSDYTWEEMYEEYLIEGPYSPENVRAAQQVAQDAQAKRDAANATLKKQRRSQDVAAYKSAMLPPKPSTTPTSPQRPTVTPTSPQRPTVTPTSPQRPTVTPTSPQRPTVTPPQRPTATPTTSSVPKTAPTAPTTPVKPAMGTTAGGTKFERRAATGDELRAAQASRAAGGSEEDAIKAGVNASEPKFDVDKTGIKPLTTFTKPPDKKTPITSSFDYFDDVKGYLIYEGYADTEEAALAIMANMSEDWKYSIILESRDSVNDYTYQGDTAEQERVNRGVDPDAQRKAQRVVNQKRRQEFIRNRDATSAGNPPPNQQPSSGTKPSQPSSAIQLRQPSSAIQLRQPSSAIQLRQPSSAIQLRQPSGGSGSAATNTAARATGKGILRGLGRVAGPASAALDVANERSKGSGWLRSLAKGAVVAAGGAAGGAAGSVAGPVGTVAGSVGGSMAAGKAFDTVAGANAVERKAIATANRKSQSGGEIKGIGGPTSFSQKKPGGAAFISTGSGPQRRTAQLAKTSVVTGPGGKQEVGNLAFKDGKAVYKRSDTKSLAQTSSNPLERIGRTIAAGAYKANDAKLAATKLTTARTSDDTRNKTLGVKLKPGG